MYPGDAVETPAFNSTHPSADKGEVTRELNNLRRSVEETLKLSEALITRLAAVIAPISAKSDTSRGPRNEVATPMATDLRDINSMSARANEQLAFILHGTQL